MYIRNTLILILCFVTQTHAFFSPLRPTAAATQQFFIMIDPAGDAKQSGRKIDDSLERGIALQCAEALKTALEQRYGIRVVLTRFPGETVEPLQNANFANRLKVDLYISLHFYQEQLPRPQFFIYRCTQGNEFITKTHELCWHPYDQAHQINGKITKQWAQLLRTGLEHNKNLFDFRGVCGLPCKPLLGITAPAFLFEIGIQKEADWRILLEPIVASLQPVIAQGSLNREDAP